MRAHERQDRWRRAMSLAAAAVGTVAMVAGCSSSGSKSSGDSTPTTDKAAATSFDITLTDEGCGTTKIDAKAGTVTFNVTNKSKVVGEFEIIASGPHLVTEQEGIQRGKTVPVPATVSAGKYQLVCTTPAKDRGSLTVTGQGGELDPKVAAALQPVATSYHTYAVAQAQELLAGTEQFVAAIKAGNAEQAKALYSKARLPYERIEPIAELFPDLDASIDARADDYEKQETDPEFTGWHRIEAGLWGYDTTPPADIATLVPFADRLLSDTQSLVKEISALTIQPQTVANGAAGLIEEAAQSKISGEEERYSHVDIATLIANVDGAKKVIELLTPAIQDASGGAQVLADVQADFANVDKITSKLADATQPSGYVLYDKLPKAEHDSLQAGLSALSEDLANVPGALGIKVN